MGTQKGYYTDDLKIFYNCVYNPKYIPYSNKIYRYRFFVLQKGKASIFYNGTEYVLKENQMIFTDIGVSYGYSFYDGIRPEYLEMMIHPTVLAGVQENADNNEDFLRALNNMPDSERVIDLNQARFGSIRQIIGGICKCLDRDSGRAHLLPRVCAIISELDFYYDKRAKLQDGASAKKTEQAITAYVRRHFYEKITYSDIYDKFGVTHPTAVKMFKSSFGCTMHDYILSLRLEAVDELKNDNVNIATAAKMSGFDHYSTFLRAYKAKRGRLPAEHIEKNRPYPNI